MLDKTKEQWINDAINLYQAKHYEDALRACENAIQIDPQFARAFHGKGLVLMKLSNLPFF